MNLEDVLDPEYGLQQDGWSLTRPRFGDQGQLEVIGWSGRGSSQAKFYILHCGTCVQDSALFGEGLFRSPKGSLVKGSIPCGCARSVWWSEQQYRILCQRKAVSLGYTFGGWSEVFGGRHTRTKLVCDKHGEWNSTSISNLINHGRGCPVCAYTAKGLRRRIPDRDRVAEFFSSGQFPEGTDFRRSPRLDSYGVATYWYVYCPECDSTNEGLAGHLSAGHRPCLCSPARQKQAYINWVVGDRGQALALKFGIANVAEQRVKQQNATCQYEVRPHLVYEFPTKQQCLAAERECKGILLCGILSQEEMPDGYTETTCPSNLARIKSIYEKHGGVLQ